MKNYAVELSADETLAVLKESTSTIKHIIEKFPALQDVHYCLTRQKIGTIEVSNTRGKLQVIDSLSGINFSFGSGNFPELGDISIFYKDVLSYEFNTNQQIIVPMIDSYGHISTKVSSEKCRFPYIENEEMYFQYSTVYNISHSLECLLHLQEEQPIINQMMCVYNTDINYVGFSTHAYDLRVDLETKNQYYKYCLDFLADVQELFNNPSEYVV